MNRTSSSQTPRLQHDIRVEADNMKDLHHRLCRMLACNSIHAKELAALFLQQLSGTSVTSTDWDAHTVAAFCENWFSIPAPADDSHCDPLITHLAAHMSVTERLCFYRALTVAAQTDPIILTARLLGQSEPIVSAAKGAIAYQHNIYTDEAFLHFSRLIPQARAQYSDGFIGVCEQVFNGKCEYCILPLENTQDGKLVRFYQMIERYELKIVLTCSVTTSDNRHSTVFGLCRRGLDWPHLPIPGKSFCFEFLFWQEPEHATLGEVLTAAACSSLNLVRADCLPRSDEEILIGAGYPFSLCLESAEKSDLLPLQSSQNNCDFLAFLLYLSLHAPSYLPLGIYQRL